MEDDKIEVKTVQKEDVKLMKSMSHIRHKIIVTSGKGGVGKSTVSSNIAMLLSMRGYEVGLLDADIHGPNIPKMFHIEDAVLHGDNEGIMPVIVPPHLKVMSMAFLVPDSDEPIIWRGPLKIGALRQFLADVRWGELDFLIIDLPPGTGDEPLTVMQLLPEADGSVVVTTPQDVALQNSRKSIGFSRKLNIPVLGIIENMSGLTCPHCGKEIDLFKIGGGEKAAVDLEVPFLGRIPLDPEVVTSGDEGMPIVISDTDSPAAVAYGLIVDEILKRVKEERA
jgi:ATP-binding protein involved in chromosome partitioning